MSWRDIDLTTKLMDGFTLKDPFWVASAHFSEPSMFKVWAQIGPAALTLKTTTKMDLQEPEKKPKKGKINDILPRYGRSYYTDAPKSDEFYTYEQTVEHLNRAKADLKETKVGVSVLATDKEDFETLRQLTTHADFLELNLKYSMRVKSESGESFFSLAAQKWKDSLGYIEKFLSVFNGVPVFVKLPRETTWLPGTEECKQLLECLQKHGKAGLIIANTLKLDIPKFVHDAREQDFQGGVITGDALYDSTIKFIASMKQGCSTAGIPLIATGGMVDEQQILIALREGANAVQLCTAFEYYRTGYYRTLQAALRARIYWRGLPTATEYISRLKTEGVASIYSMPFIYYSGFWEPDAQEAIRTDIKYSDRMDGVVMSGYTLFEQWRDPLRSRLKDRKSVRFMLPNPEGDIFGAIQKAWGLDAKQLESRKERVHTSKKILDDLFTAESATLTEEEKKDMQKERVRWTVGYYDQCPFYSFYLFDDKAYLAQYPFLRPGRLASPVYVFFRSSPEYARLEKEWMGLKSLADQVSV